MSERKQWKVGDVIRCPGYSGGFRVWRVTGIYLGGEGQESVVGLETLDRVNSTEGREMHVPVELLDNAMGAFVE